MTISFGLWIGIGGLNDVVWWKIKEKNNMLGVSGEDTTIMLALIAYCLHFS